ncbi:MAG: BatA domain-containing protein [Pirellulales bacterium]
MFSWLGINAVNPLLLWGAIAVAAPIIIHLLSKRKFRVVNWAAMDFLLEADRRNRRRVRLENLILLLLRCLAMLLLAMLVSRLFFTPEGIGQAATASAGFERILVLDDSPSMRAVRDNKKWSFDEAKTGLIAFVEELAQSHAGDRITLLVTSQPEVPLIDGKFLRAPTTADGAEDELGEIIQAIKNVEPSDRTADLDRTLLAVEKRLKTDAGHVNRVVYLVTDLRRMDWTRKPEGSKQTSPTKAGSAQGAVQSLRRVAKQASGFVVVDVGSDATRNLTVTDIQLRDDADERSQLVAGVPSMFVVHVRNNGTDSAANVDVEFSAGDTGSQKETIKEIKPGDTAPVKFSVTLPRSEDTTTRPDNVLVRASIAEPDVLPDDNQRLFAGRVTPGVQVLIVDGDPREESEKSERHFLSKALAPSGDELTQFRVQWRSDTQFEDALALEPFQLIYLGNLYRFSDEQAAALGQWVKAGGGLVVALGDKIDADWYNQKLYDNGKGLLPLAIESRQGDETEKKWVNFATENRRHPMFRVFEESQQLIHEVKAFQWWSGKVPDAEVKAGRTVINVSFNDPETTPAVIERSFGNGHVMVSTIPLDQDWSDWPTGYCFVPWMIDMARYLARKPFDEANLLVGQSIRQRLDPAEYKSEVKVLFRPPVEKAKVEEQLAITENASMDEATKRLDFDYAATEHVGFYELQMSRFDGEPDRRLFAGNLDPAEGDLTRITPQELSGQLGDSAVQFVSLRPSLSVGGEGAKREFWFPILVGLMGVLGVEQLLGWLFGQKRR